MRNAVMKNFKNVLQAYTTNTNIEGVEYCVAGKALVKDSEVEKFERKLRRLKTDAKVPVGISELKMLVSK
ncbi:MAG: hypothetical protein OXP12_07000 [Thaumarchaeota archaeon]|nr:hypothetical protein [Nitrososphaerota archaeon]MDE0266241.1 hypothetical protein [Nitrososphaerota archaeon]